MLRGGELSAGETLEDLMAAMGPDDVYIKGVNALDPQGNVGIMVGNPTEGGTIGFFVSTGESLP